jgi:hypothetical protein
MTASTVYQASPAKRQRATKAEMETRRAALIGIVAEGQPMTVRQVFYQATVLGIVEKSEAGCTRVQTDLVHLRRHGGMPWGWITDNTRFQRKPRTFGGIGEALEDTARLYRRDLWREAGACVEVWIEKDALSGVVYPITAAWDVPLMVARGYASLSFLRGAAEDRPVFIYHMGDFDPSGVDAGRKIEAELRAGAPDAEIHFERLAVTEDQIADWRLPTRPTKQTDSRAKGFGAISVELDAIPPHRLRTLVEDALVRHLPRRQFDMLKQVEADERRQFRQIAAILGRADE